LGHHPITYGDVTSGEEPKDLILTHPDSHYAQERLDYIFFSEGYNYEFNISVKKGSSKIQPFYTQGEIFGQLSDHYGIETIIVFKNREYMKKKEKKKKNNEDYPIEENTE